MKPRLRVGLMVAMLASGCGGSSRGTATLSDGLGTLALTEVTGSVLVQDQWHFVVNAESRGLPYFTFFVGGVGTTLSTGTWAPSNTLGAQGQLNGVDSAAQNISGDFWFVLTGNTVYGNDENRGTFELNLTSLGPNVPSQPVWQAAHGTLTATFTPEPTNGPSGAVNVTLDATF
ncbi:MAG: hypothetical protein ACLPJH_06810 [Myxococcaceae bacterium]